MRIVYYTTGVSGSGRIVRGIAIGNALRRNGIDCSFTILCSGGSARIAQDFFPYRDIPIDDELRLSRKHWESSELYRAIAGFDPDLLIVDRLWFAPFYFIESLRCKKIFLSIMVRDDFFRIEHPEESLSFRPEHYDRVLAVEPFTGIVPMETINPMILRNRNEILTREAAIEKLGISRTKPNCLIALNFKEGYFKQLVDKYAYLKDEGYEIFTTTNTEGGGVFPIVDYFNAFDFIVCGAGYNQFWEVVFFNKEAVMEPLPLQYSDTIWRLQNCQEYYFDENGADQLAKIIMNL